MRVRHKEGIVKNPMINDEQDKSTDPPYGFLMDLMTEGKKVPNIWVGDYQCFLDIYIPENQIICSPKFAAKLKELLSDE